MIRARAALVGLDGAGKSSIALTLQGRRVMTKSTRPTSGCNKMTLYRTRNGLWSKHPPNRCSFSLELLDLGGGEEARSYWGAACAGVDALIVVVDVSEKDQKRWTLLASEIRKLTLSVDGSDGVLPVLALLNRKGCAASSCAPPKQDLERLGLEGQVGVHALATSSSGDNAALRAGLDWLWTILGPDPTDELTTLSSSASSHSDSPFEKRGLDSPRSETMESSAPGNSESIHAIFRAARSAEKNETCVFEQEGAHNPHFSLLAWSSEQTLGVL